MYLQAPSGGGETVFDFGLAVEPEAGTALVFPTARLPDGAADERYWHRGDAVRGPVPKWIVGTWLMEQDRAL